jgi:hypothetical protein
MLKRGTQIIYVPYDVDDLDDFSCEEGFVTSVDEEEGVAYCRFWHRNFPTQLRTKSRSERVALEWLREQDTRAQRFVDETLRRLEDDT